jgi:hypothetical protein
VLSWDNLIPGTYNVTESNPGRNWTVVIDPKQVRVVSNETAFGNVTNTYIPCKGKIEIKKLGGQGCTPGYWKTPIHFADWTDYDPSDEVGDVFTLPLCVDELASDTLLEALSYHGGNSTVEKAQILLRAAVAALLSAASPDVNYPRTVDGVLVAVDEALASCNASTMGTLATDLDRDNNLGCPLGQEQDEETLLGGACFNITPDPWSTNDTLTVCDNETGDSNNTAGVILIANVTCGNYTVTESKAPPGFVVSTDSQNVTVTHNSTETLEFTNTRECDGCLEICKYEDKNANRHKDYGEHYLSGWNFTITGPDGKSWNVTTGRGFGDASEEGLGCDYCDYCVSTCDLDPGNYTVTETLKDGWTCTTDAGDPPQRVVTVECGETETVEFGNRGPCDGCLEICKYEDKNANRHKDYGEHYLSGWNFTITDSDGKSWNVTTGRGFGDASEEGLGCDYCDYCVSTCDLDPGIYTVTETLKDGWRCTTDAGDAPQRTVTVECGETERVKFGNQRESSGELFFDSFEGRLRNWVQDSQWDWFCHVQRAVDGRRSAEVDGSAIDSSLILKDAIDLSEMSGASLSFSWFIERGLDTGEYLALDLWNGTAWDEVARLRGNVDQENIWHDEVIDLGAYCIEDFRLRFRGTMSSRYEDANVDAVRIVGY